MATIPVSRKKFLWLDMEMTGLDERTEVILEVAAVVTDFGLRAVDQYQAVVKQPQAILDSMNDWCKKTHGASGLTHLVETQGKDLALVEEDLMAIIERNFARNARVVLAGNSIWNDRRFVEKYLPQFAKRLHYRMVDVSSFKEVYRERYGLKVEKKSAHRAIDDINESIHELQTYLSWIVPRSVNPLGAED